MNYTALFRYQTSSGSVSSIGGRRICVHTIPCFNDVDILLPNSLRWDVYARWAPPSVNTNDECYVHCGFIRVEGIASLDFFEKALRSTLTNFAPQYDNMTLAEVILRPMCQDDVLAFISRLNFQIKAKLSTGCSGALLTGSRFEVQVSQREEPPLSNPSPLCKILRDVSSNGLNKESESGGQGCSDGQTKRKRQAKMSDRGFDGELPPVRSASTPQQFRLRGLHTVPSLHSNPRQPVISVNLITVSPTPGEGAGTPCVSAAPGTSQPLYQASGKTQMVSVPKLVTQLNKHRQGRSIYFEEPILPATPFVEASDYFPFCPPLLPVPVVDFPTTPARTYAHVAEPVAQHGTTSVPFFGGTDRCYESVLAGPFNASSATEDDWLNDMLTRDF